MPTWIQRFVRKRHWIQHFLSKSCRKQEMETSLKNPKKSLLAGGFKYSLFSPLLGEDSHFVKPPTSLKSLQITAFLRYFTSNFSASPKALPKKPHASPLHRRARYETWKAMEELYRQGPLSIWHREDMVLLYTAGQIIGIIGMIIIGTCIYLRKITTQK